MITKRMLKLIIFVGTLGTTLLMCAIQNISRPHNFTASFKNPTETNFDRIVITMPVAPIAPGAPVTSHIPAPKQIRFGHYQNGGTFAGGSTMGTSYTFFEPTAFIELLAEQIPAPLQAHLTGIKPENIDFAINIRTNELMAIMAESPIGAQIDTFNVVFHSILAHWRQQPYADEGCDILIKAGIFNADGVNAIGGGISFNALGDLQVVPHPAGTEWAYSPDNGRFHVDPSRHIVTFWTVGIYDPTKDPVPAKRSLEKKAHVSFNILLYDAPTVTTAAGAGLLKDRTTVNPNPFITGILGDIGRQPTYDALITYFETVAASGALSPADQNALRQSAQLMRQLAASIKKPAPVVTPPIKTPAPSAPVTTPKKLDAVKKAKSIDQQISDQKKIIAKLTADITRSKKNVAAATAQRVRLEKQFKGKKNITAKQKASLAQAIKAQKTAIAARTTQEKQLKAARAKQKSLEAERLKQKKLAAAARAKQKKLEAERLKKKKLAQAAAQKKQKSSQTKKKTKK